MPPRKAKPLSPVHSLRESKLKARSLPFKIVSRSSSSSSEDESEEDITPEILLVLIDNDEFIKKVIDTLNKLYQKKQDKYEHILEILPPTEESSSPKTKKVSPEIIVNEMISIAIEAQNRKHLNPITIRENLRQAITDPNNGIVSISGDRRKHIRNHLCRQLFMLSKGYQPFIDLFMNIIFMGPAGVGKSKVAQTVAFVYSKSGILLKPPPRNIFIISPKDLIGGFVGQTATKTANLLLKGLESVIFIDEAYSVMNCVDGKINSQGESYGPEAITEIVNYLDKFVGLSVMIVAGYEREIKGCFLAANEGLNRRFPYKYLLPKYMPFDLLKIFTTSVNSRIGHQMFSEKELNYMYSIFIFLDRNDVFTNQAGDILNLVGMFFFEIFGNRTLTWNQSEKDNETMINNTFKKFLKSKHRKLAVKK